MKRRGAFVKSENYIRPQILLYLYGNFRFKFVFFSVVSKNNSVPANLDRTNDIGCRWTNDIRCRLLVGNFAYFVNFPPAETEDLEAAAVGHYRIFQPEFFMQSAGFFYFLHFARYK